MQENLLIEEDASIKSALKKLNKSGKRILLVIDKDERLLGTLTDGDMRRYILTGKSLDDDIRDAYNKNPAYVRHKDFSLDLAKKILLQHNVELVPIVNEVDKIVDFITWNQAFSKERLVEAKVAKIKIPVVIMAGGKGERLEPFSAIFPKALIPVKDKPIIEIIIDEFQKQGASQFYFTLNYKGEMIKSYFGNGKRDYEIKFVEEKEFLGTAGSLKLVEKEIDDVFIVSNCDVIVKADFEEVISLHKKENASLTILSAIQHFKIPFGVIKFKDKGEVVDVLEKPEYTFTINAGVYILNKNCLQLIPDKTCFDMTELIKKLIGDNKKVITYPVNENDYIDIGQWEEYKKSLEKMKF